MHSPRPGKTLHSSTVCSELWKKLDLTTSPITYLLYSRNILDNSHATILLRVLIITTTLLSGPLYSM